MTRFQTLLAVALFTGGIILAQSAAAQGPATYSPQTPTVSPWMGLWQQNTGPLDNYHTFVQPQMQLNATLQMQNAALNHQAARLQALNSEIMQPQAGLPGMAATGQGATFMNYSHYYGGSRPIPRPVHPRSSPPSNMANMPTIPGVSQ